MQQNKRKTAADCTNHLGIGRGQRLLRRKDFRAVTNDQHARGLHSFQNYPRPHVFAKDDDVVSAAQRPAMHFFPNTNEQAVAHDISAHGHVRIQVPDVVHVRLPLQPGHERSNDSLERRIGHGQHNITIKK